MPTQVFKRLSLCLVLSMVASPIFVGNVYAASSALSLPEAIANAQFKDLGVLASQQRQQALLSQSIAADNLPDPKVSLGVANLPVNNFDFNQEPMTQVVVSVSQAFPRGESRSLMRTELSEKSVQLGHVQEDRKAQIAMLVAELWLDAYKYRQSMYLIEQNKSLFKQLVEVAQSSYATASNNSRQQDIVRAQLELSSLEEKLMVFQAHFTMAKARLSEWDVMGPQTFSMGNDFDLADKLPQINKLYPQLNERLQQKNQNAVMLLLNQHPKILAMDSHVQAQMTEVELAKQKYLPEWGVNASYGYRDDDLVGQSRDDFFSLGLSFTLPLFTSNRQDKDVQAAVHNAEALRTDKFLMIRKLATQYQTEKINLQQLEQRERLYQQRLLKQMSEQAEAALNAYTHDTGDFAEVMRARIAELNAKIDVLELTIGRYKSMAKLNYFLIASSNVESMALSQEYSNEN